MVIAALVSLAPLQVYAAAMPPPSNPRVACAVYKAKIRQWKDEAVRSLEGHPPGLEQEERTRSEYKNAMASVLLFLGFTPA